MSPIHQQLESYLNIGVPIVIPFSVVAIEKEGHHEYLITLKPKFILLNIIPLFIGILVQIDDGEQVKIRTYINLITVFLAMIPSLLFVVLLFFEFNHFSILAFMNVIVFWGSKVLMFLILMKKIRNLFLFKSSIYEL